MSTLKQPERTEGRPFSGLDQEQDVSQYEVEGTVKKVFDLMTFNSGFTKREFVVTTDEKYPQDIKLECVKDKCSMLDDLNENDRVKVSFNLRGNEYNEKFYVNLQAWRIEKGAGAAAPADSGIPPELDEEPLDGDDLPF